MKHQVVLTDQASRELAEAADWWARHRSAQQAARWYAGLSQAIHSLADSPTRCPLAAESGQFRYELRDLHFGLGSRPSHRAVFTLVADVVVILTIRHVAQRALQPRDVELH